MNEIFDSLNEEYHFHTFSKGITGCFWVLNHAKKNNLISMNLKSLDFYNKFLKNSMITEIKNDNYDFLHGAIGIGLYLLEKSKNKSIYNYIGKLIDCLYEIKETENTGFKWYSLINSETELYGYNLSLSHGSSSIICFLSKVHSKGFFQEKTKILLDGAIEYILKNGTKNKEDFLYPSWVPKDNSYSTSRLAWCYGDLGIAIALYYAGVSTNNNDLINKSIENLTHTSNRRDLIKENVLDACLCHGTAGIAHIYKRMYRNTGIEKFKETHDFWINETLKMAKFKDGLAGYKKYQGLDSGEWRTEYGFLDGIAGIGLTLLSSISDEDPSWDECLLLS